MHHISWIYQNTYSTKRRAWRRQSKVNVTRSNITQRMCSKSDKQILNRDNHDELELLNDAEKL